MSVLDNVTEEPCPVCLELAKKGKIQSRAVMPLPPVPPRLRCDGRQCCHDCQAAETSMALGGHPSFAASRLTIANERCEGFTMPVGMMKLMGLCSMGIVRPCCKHDLTEHSQWLERHGIPNSCYLGEFE